MMGMSVVVRGKHGHKMQKGIKIQKNTAKNCCFMFCLSATGGSGSGYIICAHDYYQRNVLVVLISTTISASAAALTTTLFGGKEVTRT